MMLREKVVDVVREGRFRVWAVSRIDQGIEILTGIPAGEVQPDGSYPEGSTDQRARLQESAESLRRMRPSRTEGRGRDGNNDDRSKDEPASP